MMTTGAIATALMFNLVCAGETTIIGMPPVKSFHETLRIDLASGRYCDAECTSTSPIASVTATEIVLYRENLPSVPVEMFKKVSREDGTFIAMTKLSIGTTVQRGKCTVTPFTGFPKPLF